ncbi:MAG: FAD-dependent oxidoreductase [Roseovarius sp.]|jgi:2,4-dienoyl-CoA reductase-like NADH-dependent reductase (Old Yellow Enzyme family)|nr:FAD-dependent oxidoreductase [Roseovarius sp.]
MPNAPFYPRLFAPLTLGGFEIRNRIASTGHQTFLAENNLPGGALVAYHEARARGGAALIVTEAARFHESAFAAPRELRLVEDSAIPAYARLAKVVQGHGARIIGQLSHSGRVSHRMREGHRGVAYAPSPVPDRRYQTVPRQMSTELIEELVTTIGTGARRYAEAGYDGVELMASHGLLFAQFLNPAVNRRTDAYGGTLDNRMRFLCESLAEVRRKIRIGMVIGLRISAEDFELDGTEPDEIEAACSYLAKTGAIDYLNVTAGSMAGLGGSIHVVPPMEIASAYLASHAGRLRAATGLPILVAGRINQPQEAEQVLAGNYADICGMTRAMITDPELAAKARSGRGESIKACIGCNQACIGHLHKGVGISCIQSPLSGREARFAPALAEPARTPGRILVVGGGPAGMRAAVTAAQRGHNVLLMEAAPMLGGQALLAQRLPERAEFGGLITNLEMELASANVEIRMRQFVDRAMIEAEAPDALILATGARPAPLEIEIEDDRSPVLAVEVLQGTAQVRRRVVIADWRCDWVGIGTAAHLAAKGHHVRLAVDGVCAGQNLPTYVRDYWAGRLHALGVEVIPYVRAFGMDADTAYFSQSVTGAPILFEGVDDLVISGPYLPDTRLEDSLSGLNIRVLRAGDCLSPRTAEEAVYEGFLAGLEA